MLRLLIFSLSMTMAISSAVSAQDSLSLSYTHSDLVNDSLNVLGNVSALDPFFENLYLQKIHNDRKISIVHIGDSHIQGDYMTTILRKRLQRSFGNAGRGLVVPYRVAGTNEPANLLTSSTVTWTAKRCVHPDQPLPIGVGGITIHTQDTSARIYLYLNDPSIDHAFDRITLFHLNDSASFQVRLKNPDYTLIANEASYRGGRLSSQFLLNHKTSSLVVETTKNSDRQNHFTLFGLELENGFNGVSHHAIGVNGAKFQHYNKAKYFRDQVSMLQPTLIIISLGTNESLEYPYINKRLEEEIDVLIKELSSKNPLAKFIIATPQENFQKEKLNPGVKSVRDILIKYAVENGHSFWDWYLIAGGTESAPAWRKATMLRSDGVHLSKDGYELQGHVFYHAIMKGYEQYVSNRHP